MPKGTFEIGRFGALVFLAFAFGASSVPPKRPVCVTVGDVFNDVYAVVKRTQAITYTEQRADEEAQKAIDALTVLPESDYKNALVLLAKFAVQRNY